MGDLTFDLQNIAKVDGYAVAVTGMIIVFVVLSLISLFISLLPRILELLAPYLPPETESHMPAASVETSDSSDDALVAAIGFVLQKELEQNR